ncbi:hypothetical protein [Clostridium sp. CCUG 7971]|uniref:hypothetical protein n=1 Tax=Clostridium sp. CCUG 7971 TaxID=2811414 RepID=UPI001ABA789E|nr:hypothetical protein [Clostridium sp. CCUG 7971]MBO3444970.1 hypothetical protein [Clostridium sp. CCUG 7971]
MIINFYNSKDDYIKHVSSSSKLIEKFLNFFFIIFLIIETIGITFKFEGAFMFFVFIATSMLCFIIYLIYKLITKPIFCIVSKMYVEKNLNKVLNNYPNMIGNKIIEVNSDKLIINTNDERAEYDYSKITINTFHSDIIDIGYNIKILCTIPTNVFSSKEEKEEFIKLIKQKRIKARQNKITKAK